MPEFHTFKTKKGTEFQFDKPPDMSAEQFFSLVEKDIASKGEELSTYKYTAQSGNDYEFDRPADMPVVQFLSTAQKDLSTIAQQRAQQQAQVQQPGQQPGILDIVKNAGMQALGSVQTASGELGGILSGRPPQQLYDVTKGILEGAAVRGNEAMIGLNPFAGEGAQEWLAGQQAAIADKPGAGVGRFLADMAIQAPTNVVPGGPIGRALASGAVESLTRPGGAVERLKNLGGGAVGSLAGEGVGALASSVMRPFGRAIMTPLQRETVENAQELGLPIRANDANQNPALQNLDSALDTLPTSSGMQRASKRHLRNEWQRLVLGQIENAPRNVDTASPNVMGDIKSRISAVYDDVTSRNRLFVDKQLQDEILTIKSEYLAHVAPDEKKVVDSYIDEILKNQDNTVPGEIYQKLRSRIGKRADNFRGRDSDTSFALDQLQRSLDNAFFRNVIHAEDQHALRMANRDYSIMKGIEAAIDKKTGDIDPNRYLNEVTKRNRSGVLYGASGVGNQETVDLARIGAQIIAPQTKSSGTAERNLLMSLILKAGSLPGMATTAALSGGVGGLGGAGLGAAGSALAPMLLSKAMQSPTGWLASGIGGLDQPVAGDLTREAIMNLLLRQSGAYAGSELQPNF